MKIRIFWPGKTKERCINEGINRYLELLRHFAGVSVTEIKEEKGLNRDSCLQKEGKRILKQTQSFFLLDEKGRTFTSKGFADFIESKVSMDFVIGGAFGVSDEVREMASERIALSRMTFTHEMARLILMEQLYRAMTIIKGREYHY